MKYKNRYIFTYYKTPISYFYRGSKIIKESIENPETIELDNILSEEIDEFGYRTIIGVYYDKVTCEYYRCTIYKVNSNNEILTSSENDIMFELLLWENYINKGDKYE